MFQRKYSYYFQNSLEYFDPSSKIYLPCHSLPMSLNPLLLGLKFSLVVLLLSFLTESVQECYRQVTIFVLLKMSKNFVLIEYMYKLCSEID